MAELEINALGPFCAHCEELQLEKDWDEEGDCDVLRDSYRCANVEHCRWILDEWEKYQRQLPRKRVI